MTSSFCSRLLVLTTFLAVIAGCSRDKEASAPTESASERVLTVYSGRTEAMVAPLFARFQEETGIRLRVQYAETSQLAATLLEEGARSPADVFLAQDAATLGLLEEAGLLAPLPESLVERVPIAFRSPAGTWIGVSGRARVLSYHPDRVSSDELPTSLDDLLHERWRGRLGWAPNNASFQAMMAAMVQERGPEETARWVRGMVAQQPRVYPSNSPMVQAVGAGEVDLVLTNHYYLYRLRAERGERFNVENHYLRSGDAGSLVNVSAVTRLQSSRAPELAEVLIAWLLDVQAQELLAGANHEFPLAAGVLPDPSLSSVDELRAPQLDLARLGDLEGAVRILRAEGATR